MLHRQCQIGGNEHWVVIVLLASMPPLQDPEQQAMG